MFYFIRKLFNIYMYMMYTKINICIPNKWCKKRFAIQQSSSNAIYKGNCMVKMVYWDGCRIESQTEDLNQNTGT